MKNAYNHPLASLGLVGDGDEIAAITEVERSFGVRLDYAGAPRWATVGDVFVALRQTLPPEQATDGGTWLQFTRAISNETGVDYQQVTADTLLLVKSRLDMRIALVAAFIVGVAVAVARHW